jgi:hypothetical protein
LAVAVAASVLGDTTIVSSELGYAVYLPDNWVQSSVTATHHQFYDTTGARPGLLSLVRSPRSSVDFPTEESWTRAYYIAYLLTADPNYSYDPWGVVLYADSSQDSRQNALWAPEAYARWFSLDTAWSAWAEYVRFTASGDYGYELYAVSDTADMDTSIGYYASILQGIDIPGSTAMTHVEGRGARRGLTGRAALRPSGSLVARNPLGRVIRFRTHRSRSANAAGARLLPGEKTLVIH